VPHDPAAPGRRDLRIFAALLAAFAGLGAWVLVRRGVVPVTTGWALATIAAALAAVGLVRPALIGPVHRVWHAVTAPIGQAVSALVLGVVFVAVVTPVGLLLRCLGRDPLDRRHDTRATSYWKRRGQPADDDHYFRQF